MIIKMQLNKSPDILINTLITPKIRTFTTTMAPPHLINLIILTALTDYQYMLVDSIMAPPNNPNNPTTLISVHAGGQYNGHLTTLISVHAGGGRVIEGDKIHIAYISLAH